MSNPSTNTVMVSVSRLQLAHLRNESRLLFVIVLGSMIFDMFDPALVILRVPESMYYRIAGLTHQRELIASTLMMCACLLVPYTLMHMTHKWRAFHRLFCKMAILGLVVSATTWTFLCFTSWRVETGVLTFVLFRQIIGSLLFAGFLAIMLNNELKREKELEERRKAAEQSLLRRLQTAIQIRPHEGEDDSYAPIQGYSRHAAVQQSST